jgi:hypothetical protein
MGCTLNEGDSSPGSPPPFLNPQSIDLEHLGGERFLLSVTFAAPPRPEPREIQLSDGTTMLAPGNVTYGFTVSTPELLARPGGKQERILIDSPGAPGFPWVASKAATDSAFTEADFIPATVSASGRNIGIELNLADHAQLMKQTPFKPVVLLLAVVSAARPGKAQYVGNFDCGWTTSAASREASAPPAPVPTPTVREPAPKPAAGLPPDGKPCPPKYGATGAYTRSAVGNDETSCAFAEEVRISYADMGSPGSVQQIKVFSPTTQQQYDVTCQPADRWIICTGGNGAVVYLN